MTTNTFNICAFINTSYRSAVRAVSSFNLSFFSPQHFDELFCQNTQSVWHVCRLCVTTSRHAHARPGCCCGAVKGQQLLQKQSLSASAECSKAHLRPFSLSDKTNERAVTDLFFPNSATLLTRFCFLTSLLNNLGLRTLQVCFSPPSARGEVLAGRLGGVASVLFVFWFVFQICTIFSPNLETRASC